MIVSGEKAWGSTQTIEFCCLYLLLQDSSSSDCVPGVKEGGDISEK